MKAHARRNWFLGKNVCPDINLDAMGIACNLTGKTCSYESCPEKERCICGVPGAILLRDGKTEMFLSMSQFTDNANLFYKLITSYDAPDTKILLRDITNYVTLMGDAIRRELM